MGKIDDIGEAVVTFLSSVLYHVVGFLILLIRVSRSTGGKLDGRIKIYQYFEKRNVELKDYIVLKAQAATLLFLASVVGYVFGFLDTRILTIFVLFGGYSLYMALVQLKEHFIDDYSAYRTFFLSYFAISVLLVLVKSVKPTVNFVFPYFHLLAISVFSVVAASYLFKQKYARNYTFGRVTKGGDFISVKVNYDLRSSVKPGVHVFENKHDAKEGDIVKLLVESHGFNLSGSRIVGPIPQEQPF